MRRASISCAVFRSAPARSPRRSTRWWTRSVGYDIVHIEDVEPGGPGNAVRFMRRALGAEAFGINWFELPPNTEGYEHSEANSRQEEVTVVVKGSGSWRIEGEDVPAREGTFLR